MPTEFKLILATLYLSHVLAATSGPFAVFAWMRDHLPHGRSRPYIAPNGDHIERYGVLDCAICLAFWIAAAAVLAPAGVLLDVLAVAGGAVALRSFAGVR